MKPNAVSRKKNFLISLAAFLIPALIMLFICVAEGFYPFGSVSILVADMKVQFVDYIGYMKSIFFGNNDFLYTFSKTLGGDMTGFAAYYLFNPFFLILLLFPNSELPAGIVLIVILMCGCSGLTFNLLLKEVHGNRLASLIFSTSYALMGYYVAYVNCIHYFFSIIMFPLVILGLYKEYKARRVRLFYILSVAICVCSNYYIGYMVLIFTAVFFVCMVINDLESVKDLKSYVGVIWTVLYSTILGVMISAFSLVSVVYSLKGQKSSGLLLSLSRNFRLIEFFSGLYTNAFHGNVSNGLPIIYSGVIPVIFLFFLFVNKNVKIKEKILVLALLLFMILGFWIDAINIAWHGFAHPIGFPYRNSFIFSFIILFFGYKGFLMYKNEFKGLYANIFVALFTVYSAVLILMKSEYVTIRQIALTGVFIILSLICIYLLKSGRKYIVPGIVGIAVLSCIDLGYNGYKSVDSYFDDKNAEENSEEYFSNYVKEQQSIVTRIESDDDSFFRMDKLYRRTHNDAMLINYNGLSHFSSCEVDSVKRFLGKMGFRDNGNWAFYSQGSTAFAESFLGMKYLVSQYDETSKPYERLYEVNEKYIFRNPYSLGIGFGAKSAIDTVNTNEKDPFMLQNNIAKTFSEDIKDIYIPVSYEKPILYNVSKENNVYTVINPEEEAYIEYKLHVDNNNFIFMYFDAPQLQNADIYVDNLMKAPCFNMYDWCIRECGHFNAGDIVCVKFVLQQESIEIDNEYFYYEDREALKEWYDVASVNKSNFKKETSSHLYDEVTIEKGFDRYVYSIPYEKDWIVKVDGNKVKTYCTLDTLLAFDISEGNHTIEIMYIPRGLLIGSVISLIGIVTTFCVIFYQKRAKNTRKK